MRTFIFALSFSATAALLASGFNTPAQAQYCEGKVRGLSAEYDQETGSGFLAVRSKPRASSRKRGELFNGDKVEIFDRRGNWYMIATAEGDMLEGWAHARWIRNSCNY